MIIGKAPRRGFGIWVWAAPGVFPALWLSWTLGLSNREAPGVVVYSGLAYFGRILSGRF